MDTCWNNFRTLLLVATICLVSFHLVHKIHTYLIIFHWNTFNGMYSREATPGRLNNCFRSSVPCTVMIHVQGHNCQTVTDFYRQSKDSCSIAYSAGLQYLDSLSAWGMFDLFKVFKLNFHSVRSAAFCQHVPAANGRRLTGNAIGTVARSAFFVIRKRPRCSEWKRVCDLHAKRQIVHIMKWSL